MNNFKGSGNPLTVVAPANVVSGGIVSVGSIFGVAVTDALSGDDVAIHRSGVFDLPKAATVTPDAGDPAYFDGTDITDDADGGANVNVGVFTANVADGAAATCEVLLHGGNGLG